MIDNKQSAALLAVLQWGSFERAAQALHLSPSAVSQRIRALEAGIGCVLVTRERPCVATKDGLKLLPYLRHAELLAQEMAQAFADDAPLPVVHLAAHYDALDTWLMPVLAQLADEEAVLFDISGDDQEHTLRWLAEGRVLAAISSQAQALHGGMVLPLGAQRYRMLATPAFVQRHFANGISAAALAQAPAGSGRSAGTSVAAIRSMPAKRANQPSGSAEGGACLSTLTSLSTRGSNAPAAS